MKKMLFETALSGHRLEYVHHIYMGMLKHPNNDYIIVVPEDFALKKNNYEWPTSENIQFDYISKEEVKKAYSGNLISSSLNKTKLLIKYLKKYEPQKVFLIQLISFIPFLPILVPRKFQVYAIIYKIYLYEWKQYSFMRKLLEVIKYKLMIWGKCINTVFVLNDNSAVATLNRLYNSDKFRYLTDPFNKIEYAPKDIRSKLGIPDENIFFFHFGSLESRKGSIEILRAIELMDAEKLSNYSFVFAGRVFDDIKKDFYSLIKSLEHKCQILLFDEYCTTEFLADLSYSCDFILMPYQVTAQSSGLLSYAAHFGKPVIASSDGLVGKLIRKYKLGITMPTVKAESIAVTLPDCNPYIVSTNYNRINTIENFLTQIFSLF